MTTPETPGAPAPAVPVEKIRTALLGYRIMAWTTGIWLIALCYEIVSHLAFHHEIRWIEVVHGWVYFVYVLAAFNLAIKVRWPIAKTIGVLLSGTIPLLGIIVEHFQTKDVKARFGLWARSAVKLASRSAGRLRRALQAPAATAPARDHDARRNPSAKD